MAAPAAQSIAVSAAGAAIPFTATLPNAVSWLSVANGTGARSPAPVTGTTGSAPVSLTVSVNPGTLAPGTYRSSISFTSPQASAPVPPVSVTLNVQPAISASPSSLSFSYATGGAAPPAQNLTIAVNGGPALPFTATADSWITVSGGTTGTPISVSVGPTGLAAGTHTGSISITCSGASNSPLSIPVALTVAAPITATPASLAFTSVAGGTSPAAQGLLLDSSIPSPFTTTASTASGGNWLSVSPASGTTRQTVTVTAAPASLHLPAGVYTGSVSVTPPGATAVSPVTVPVTLMVTASLSLSPSALSFTASPGGQSPAPQSVAVSAGGSAIPFTARSSAAWLSVTSGATTPASVSVSVNPSAAVPGLQTGVITIHSDLESNGDQSVTVTLNVVVPTVAPSSLSFLSSTGGTPPPTQLLAVNNLLPTSFWVFANSAWLNATQTNPTTPSMVQVSVSPGGLAPGTYSGSVTIFYLGGSIQVPVTLTVAAALSVSPASLAFTYAAGGARPPSQSVSVTSGGSPISFNVTAATASGGNWLTVDTSFGVTPRALNISADPTGLRPGVYVGSVTLTATGVSDSTKTISVTLTVTAALSPSPAALSFTALAGGPPPNPQQISVTSGGTPVSITASASGGAWLSVAPTSATTPASLSVTVNPAGLAAGAYPGAITISGVGVASQTVNVSLTVVPADLVLSSSSLTYSGNSGATNPILQSISVTSNSALPLNFTVSGNLDGVPADALSVTPSSATTPTLVTVGVNPARLAAGTYSGSLQFQTAQKTYRAGISVTLVDAPPSLSVTPALMMFAPRRSSDGVATRALMIQNTGGGSALPFTVTASGGPWLSISPSSGTLSGQTASPVQVSVDPANLAPGSYQGSLHVQMGSLSQDVPLSFLVLGGQPFIGLSFKGVEFEARVGEGLTYTRDVSVFNQGGGSLNWTASIAGGSDWLSLQQGAGAFTLTTHSTSLSAGPHYATVQVSDPNAANSPQLVTVVLNMVPAGASAVPIPSPAGLLFIAAAGGPAPAAQTVSVFTSSSSPTGFQAAAQTADGGGWLSVTPTSGTTSTTNTGSVTVSVNPASLQPGVYQGGVSFSEAAGVVRTTTVTLIVVPAGTPVPLSRPATAPKAVTNCTPSKLVPIYTDLVNNFSSPAGWPVPVSVRLVDSCGNNMPGGSVVLSFSKGSPQFASMALADSSLALFTATWVPATSASQINVTAKAVSGNLQGTAQVNATVSGNTSPILNPNGTQRNVMPVAGAPLAPGTVIQIFGDNFTDSAVQATSLPLPIDMNGTQVLIGGRAAPLYYVSKNQINALIPVDLPPRDSYPVLVSVNGSITVPDTIDVVPANPGVVALPSGQVLAQHADYRLIGPDSPAAPGETIIVYLVGMGDTDPSVPSGAAAPSAEPLARVKSVPVVTLDGKPVNLLYAGLSPGGVGLYQINFTVPPDAASGNLNLAITQAGRDANGTMLPVGN
jgi:uncharacterized protein (TIGR03437 family)